MSSRRLLTPALAATFFMISSASADGSADDLVAVTQPPPQPEMHPVAVFVALAALLCGLATIAALVAVSRACQNWQRVLLGMDGGGRVSSTLDLIRKLVSDHASVDDLSGNESLASLQRGFCPSGGSRAMEEALAGSTEQPGMEPSPVRRPIAPKPHRIATSLSEKTREKEFSWTDRVSPLHRAKTIHITNASSPILTRSPTTPTSPSPLRTASPRIPTSRSAFSFSTSRDPSVASLGACSVPYDVSPTTPHPVLLFNPHLRHVLPAVNYSEYFAHVAVTAKTTVRYGGGGLRGIVKSSSIPAPSANGLPPRSMPSCGSLYSSGGSGSESSTNLPAIGQTGAGERDLSNSAVIVGRKSC